MVSIAPPSQRLAPRALHLRPLDWPTDREALRQFDTSFVTDRIFEIARGPLSISLREAPCSPPRAKRYPRNVDEESIDHALLTAAICEGDELAGFAIVSGQAWNRRAVLTDFYIDPAFRRRQVGRQLMTHLVDQLQGARWRQLWLETQNINYPAIQFYRQMGFRICGFDLTLYQAPLAQETAVFMSLDLAAG